VVSANAAFLNMTGYTQPELMGVDCSVFNGPLTDCIVATMLVEATRQQNGFSAEILNYREDGSTFWNELTLSPVPDHLGQLTHFISVNTDISARKRLDQILHEKNVELQRATNMAEQANRAKSDFLSSMSHELRSPLNAILGFAQLLEIAPPVPTPSQQGKIEKILRGGWYLLSFINEILDPALMESGKMTLTLEPVSLAHLLPDCQNHSRRASACPSKWYLEWLYFQEPVLSVRERTYCRFATEPSGQALYATRRISAFHVLP
jgi:PAS domain S-box-containing protein